ncbi:hypothetical protein GCM10027515_13320 [Schumannella luteola]|uniref:Imm-5-like domain-containing protein n=1 Tax=Schumannella luteola TaxID=472059 RepID=A0A852YJ24_9MICO|nr:hypothetical protein [Schumannella luteola]NYG97779.1 hypothetical protein [Schumannella luteola]TPW98343.1 hypothetical protein FJ656_33710 [Schumannella luteola]
MPADAPPSRPLSAQTLPESDRRRLALWTADCVERVLRLFEAEAPHEPRPRDGLARVRAYGRGELDTAGEIRRRFEAGRAAGVVSAPAAVAAARAVGQATGIAHMGAHALGAAAYAVRAVRLGADSATDDPQRAADAEIAWQIAHLTAEARDALRRLPALGADPAGPLGSGLLARGDLGDTIRALQARIASS